MNKELFVSSTPHETRLALMEDGEVVEVLYEREKEYTLAGAIYKGRVTRVLPGMQSAFVDIGLDRDAFLYVSDFFEDSEEYDRVVSEAEEAVARLEGTPVAAGTAPARAAAPAPSAAPRPEAGTEESGGERRRRGRRRRGRGRSGLPESKFAQPGEAGASPAEDREAAGGDFAEEIEADIEGPIAAETALEEVKSPAAAALPAENAADAPANYYQAYQALVLPGESLAKYRQAAPEPAIALDAMLADSDRPEEANGEVARQSFEQERVQPDSPRERRRRGRGRHGRVAAGSPEEAGKTETPSEILGAEAELSAEPGLDTGRAEGEEDVAEAPLPPSEAASPDQDSAAQAAGEAESAAVRHGVEPLRFELRRRRRRRRRGGQEGQNSGDETAVAAAEGTESGSAEEGEEAAASELPEGSLEAEGDEASAIVAEARDIPELGETTVASAPADAEAVQALSDEESRAEANIAPSVPAAPPSVERRRERRAEPGRAESNGRAPRLIGDLLHPGQEILIQIAKEPIGKKGARITSHLALPGRFLVYMPTVHHIGVSRKIASDEERARLKRLILDNSKDLPGGFIVRTAGAGASDDEFRADIRFLGNLWNDIKRQHERIKAPALLHHDLNLVERTLRDQLSNEFTHIWVDTDEQYQRIVRFVNYFMPHLAARVKLYTRDREPLFERFGVSAEIDKALKSKVWLKSGGYIVINQTEALVAIDVNTGKYVGKSNRLEDTIVKTNVDAIKEIVRQIRLRDLGGIIVIDFIDMDERRNRQKVMQTLEEAMRADRAPSKILAFNDFGLVALTRKRVKQSLERTLGSPCPYCTGVGLVKSVTTVCNEIYTEVRKMAPTIERDDLVVRVNPEVARAMKAQQAKRILELEEMTGKTIAVQADEHVHQEQFEIF